MKRMIFVVAALLSSAVFSAQSQACTVEPVNIEKQVVDMQRLALAALNVSDAQLNEVDVNDASGEYIWTPMCPKGLLAEATYTITFSRDDEPLATQCTAIVKVNKSEPLPSGWREEGEKVKHSYTAEIIQPAICLEYF